jgi:hypothetical protein
MTSKSLRAALTAILLVGAASAAMAADSGPKLTHSVAVALNDVQKAANAKDWATAQTALDKAKAAATSPYDNLMVTRFAMSIHIGQNDMAAADTDAEAAADMDPTVIPDTDKAAVYKPALQLALNTKHYDKAAKYAKLYAATTPPPPAADQALITQALYLGGDYAGATTMAEQHIAAAQTAGQRPDRNDLEIVMASQVKQKDEPGAEKSLETLVSNYNDPADWNQLLEVALTTKGMRDIDYIYMGRLMFLQAAKINSADASLIGSTASKQGLYGDAVQAEKAGGSGFPPADAKAAADQKTFASQIAAGAKQNGQYNVKTAEAAYGYGMFSDAEKLAQQAKTKGGAQDPTEADMVIAMSQAAQGKYADAATTFGAINSANPASARVVRLWLDYVKFKANPPAAAAAAAPAPAAAAAH